MGLQVQQTSLMQEREGSEEEFTSSTLSGHEAEGLRETHDPHRDSPTAENHHDTSTPESELEVRQRAAPHRYTRLREYGERRSPSNEARNQNRRKGD